MATTAAYDEIADWYETPGRAGAGPLRGGRRADSG